jgi:hypothetical protein
MKNRIIVLLTLNLTLAGVAFAAEPSATSSPQVPSSPQEMKSPPPEIQSIAELDNDYEGGI